MSDNNQGMTAEREALHTRIYELSGFAGHDDAPMLTFHENIVLGWASEAESMGSEIRRLRAENEELKRHSMNLLAVIHRDGGHYVAEHGFEKSCADAEKIICDLREEIAELKRQLNDIRHPPARMPSGEILDQGRYL